MSSSRSTSPVPPSAPKATASPGCAGGGSLSKDALYAPLSSYSRSRGGETDRAAARHSLSLRGGKSTSLPSLLSTLADISSRVGDPRRHEGDVYRALGGSLSRHGAGDGGRSGGGDPHIRGVLEGKLANRSLTLIGGRGRRSGGDGGGDGGPAEDLASRAASSASAGGGGRERRRAAGCGAFGSVSNKKRKKLLSCRSMPEKKATGGVGEGDGPASESRIEERVGAVVATLREKWIEYARGLLSPVAGTNGERTAAVLAAAEHVGMPATVARCPSRRHLVASRCVVVNETRETWTIATLLPRKQKGKKKEVNERNNKEERGGPEKGGSAPPRHRWSILMVPKRGTTLEVEVPLGDNVVVFWMDT